MSGFSSALVQGRVATAPQVREGYARFKIDVPIWLPGKDGADGREKLNKILVQVWGKAAEMASKLKVNDRVSLEGCFKQLKWQTDEGANRNTLTLQAFKIRRAQKDVHNLAVIQGHLGSDPEIKFWDDGNCQATFALAVNEYDPLTKENVGHWIDIRMKGKSAERAAEYLHKGTNVIVSGKIVTDEWEKDGVKGSRTFVETWDFRFCGGKKGGADEDEFDDSMPPMDKGYEEYERQEAKQRGAAPGDLDDEIPF